VNKSTKNKGYAEIARKLGVSRQYIWQCAKVEQGLCRLCGKQEVAKGYCQYHTERARKRTKDYYKQHCKRLLNNMRQYRKNHPEKFREYYRKWNEKQRQKRISNAHT
jgi:hypothetical protein